MPQPVRGPAESEHAREVALLAHAPAVPGAVALTKTVGDVLAAAGHEVRTGSGLLAAIGAPTDDPFTEVRSHLHQASKLYLAFELAAADAELRTAEEALASLLHDPDAVSWTRRILELRAIVLMAQDRTDASTEKLSQLFLLDPDYQADARFLSPQFAPAFEAAAETAALAPRGAVTVRTEPPGADVYADGRFAGVSPVTLDLRTGQHVLQAFLAGYRWVGAAVRVDGTPGELTMTLTPLASSRERLLVASRSVATGILPAQRTRFLREVRELAGSDAIAVVLARPTADGTLLSGEVHWDDPRIPPTRTPEFRLTSVASANARVLATGLERILDGPKPAPVVWRGRYIPPEVPDPFTLQLGMGRVDNYGTGWRKTDIPNNLISSTLNLTGLFRQQEQPHVALDWAFTIGAINGSNCYGGPEDACRSVTSGQVFLDIGPRLELRARRVFGYGGLGLGVGNHEMRIHDTRVNPEAPVFADSVVVARGFLVAGVGFQATRKFRVLWEEKVATAQGTFPTTILDDYDTKHLNVGGLTHQLGLTYRF